MTAYHALANESGGDENSRINEAREIVKERHGILVQTEGDTEFYGPGGTRLALDATCRLDDAEPPMCRAAMAYVMNRFGATVASYSL